MNTFLNTSQSRQIPLTFINRYIALHLFKHCTNNTRQYVKNHFKTINDRAYSYHSTPRTKTYTNTPRSPIKPNTNKEQTRKTNIEHKPRTSSSDAYPIRTTRLTKTWHSIPPSDSPQTTLLFTFDILRGRNCSTKPSNQRRPQASSCTSLARSPTVAFRGRTLRTRTLPLPWPISILNSIIYNDCKVENSYEQYSRVICGWFASRKSSEVTKLTLEIRRRKCAVNTAECRFLCTVVRSHNLKECSGCVKCYLRVWFRDFRHFRVGFVTGISTRCKRNPVNRSRESRSKPSLCVAEIFLLAKRFTILEIVSKKAEMFVE